jgi:1,2-diacylglycerol 3-alpha-glucosyltransferase
MAAGVPVIALNAAGVREVMHDGQNGFMLPKNANASSFAAHLAEVHGDRSRRQAFGVEAKRTAGLFSRERCADLALEFYADVRRATRRDRLLIDRSPWGQLLERVGVEWRILVEKAQTVAQAVRGR